jgi:3-hydroxybutyryl-CoA dehydrogenase
VGKNQRGHVHVLVLYTFVAENVSENVDVYEDVRAAFSRTRAKEIKWKRARTPELDKVLSTLCAVRVCGVRNMAGEIETVTMIGAGFMARHITALIVPYGYNVHVFYHRFDTNPSAIDEAKRIIDRLLRRASAKGHQGAVTYHGGLSEALKDTDLVIESIPENLELKKKVFAEIDKAAAKDVIIATNSSSIPVSRIEAAVKRKDKVLNLHFYPTLKMVDIMRGKKTSDETLEKGKKWVESIECLPLVAKKESVGLIFNRVYMAINKEYLDMWAGDYANIEDLDKAWNVFTGMPLGPFALMDWIGLDVVVDVGMSVYELTGDPRDKPPQKLVDKVKRGELGRKSGKGFYTYKK